MSRQAPSWKASASALESVSEAAVLVGAAVVKECQAAIGDSHAHFPDGVFKLPKCASG